MARAITMHITHAICVAIARAIWNRFSKSTSPHQVVSNTLSVSIAMAIAFCTFHCCQAGAMFLAQLIWITRYASPLQTLERIVGHRSITYWSTYVDHTNMPSGPIRNSDWLYGNNADVTLNVYMKKNY